MNNGTYKLPVKRLQIVQIVEMKVTDEKGDLVEAVPLIEVRGRLLMKISDFCRRGFASRAGLYRLINKGRLGVFHANGSPKTEQTNQSGYIDLKQWIKADLSESAPLSGQKKAPSM